MHLVDANDLNGDVILAVAFLNQFQQEIRRLRRLVMADHVQNLHVGGEAVEAVGAEDDDIVLIDFPLDKIHAANRFAAHAAREQGTGGAGHGVVFPDQAVFEAKANLVVIGGQLLDSAAPDQIGAGVPHEADGHLVVTENRRRQRGTHLALFGVLQ